MEEVWKDISGYEGLYQVSNMGRVKSLERIVSPRKQGQRIAHEKIKQSKHTKDGYLEVTLCKNCKPKSIRTHRLVAHAFCENPFNKAEVNHIDGNKLNNRADNLEWVTSSENQIHAYKLGLQKVSGGALSNRKRIKCLELGVCADSLHEMQQILCEKGFTKSTRLNLLSRVMNNGTQKYLGLHFEFI
jgi:hypothetical protein